jgi:hypothetical protein
MPNIFSFPIGFHFPDVRELCEDLRGLLSQICDDSINRRIVIEGDVSHRMTYFYFMGHIKQIMLDMLLPIPLNELMGVIVNSGILKIAKKMGKFLKDHPDISRLDEQALEPLKSILMMPSKNPKKSLYIGFLGLQVLYSRHLEERSVEHIKNMFNHTFLRADVVEVLRGWYRTSLDVTNPFFCETDDIFNEMFGLFFNRIAWFDVMNRGILQAPPPPPPQLALVVPQIEYNIV